MNLSTQETAYAPRSVGGDAADDAAVVSRIVKGDEAALALLYDRWVPSVYSLAVQLLRDTDEAEDVVEETFWQAWQRAASYDPARGTVRAWLLTMGRSRALDRLHTRSHTHRQHGDDGTAGSEDVLVLAADSDPLLDAAGGERRRLVLSALRALPPEQGRALELAYFHGLSQREVAERLGESLGTVKTRMRLGMDTLRNAPLALREETS